MKRMAVALMIMVCLGVIGCSSKTKLIQPITTDATNASVFQDKATIIFYRDTELYLSTKELLPFVGPLSPKQRIQLEELAQIMEVIDDKKMTNIESIQQNSKFYHKTTTGRHMYIINNNTAKTFEINIEAGKTYYVQIVQLYGIPTHFAFVLTDNIPNNISTQLR